MFSFEKDCRAVRERSPLILNITNHVAMNFTANALLAIGASPLMSSEQEEMVELTIMCSALVVNIGTLEKAQLEAQKTAAKTAIMLGRPWVLDPAGVGASRFRSAAVRELIALHPSVIRGNASEILFLAGGEARSRGVDSTEDSARAVEAGKRLARDSGAVVSISGPTDYITDGEEVVSIEGGSPLMPQVTAMGCAATAITGAFLAVDEDPLRAAAGAMSLMSAAGGDAALASEGPGTFAARFIDSLWKKSGQYE